MTTLQIQNSLDCKRADRLSKTYLAVLAIFAVLVLFVMMFVVAPDKNVVTTLLISLGIAAAFGVFVAIPLVYYAVKKRNYAKNAEMYKLYRVVLDKPTYKGKACRFQLTLPVEQNTVTVNTDWLFGSGAMAVYLTADYLDKQVDVAYNPTTGVLLVLGLSAESNLAIADTTEIE